MNSFQILDVLENGCASRDHLPAGIELDAVVLLLREVGACNGARGVEDLLRSRHVGNWA
jgi:hypothetical protein